MELISVQVGQPKDLPWQGKMVSTAIFKDPVSGRSRVHFLGVEGDRVADPSVHGGRDKAVYGYGWDAYPWWLSELSVPSLTPGSFGENLTFETLDESKVFLGDIFELGTIRLQAAEPRFPCYKLGLKFGDMKIIKTFIESDRSGVYFRVLAEGEIGKGDKLKRIQADPHQVSIWDLWTLKLGGYSDTNLMRKILQIESLSSEWRTKFEKKLA